MDDSKIAAAQFRNNVETVAGAGDQRIQTAEPFKHDGNAGLERNNAHLQLAVLQNRFGIEDGPSVLGSAFYKSRRRIYREGVPCNFQHGLIVDGVAKDAIRVRYSYAGQCFGLGFVGWDIYQLAGYNAVLDLHGRGQNMFGGNAEALYAFFNHPVTSGAYSPQFCSGLTQGPD